MLTIVTIVFVFITTINTNYEYHNSNHKITILVYTEFCKTVFYNYEYPFTPVIANKEPLYISEICCVVKVELLMLIAEEPPLYLKVTEEPVVPVLETVRALQ